jgi:hypothetical protein
MHLHSIGVPLLYQYKHKDKVILILPDQAAMPGYYLTHMFQTGFDFRTITTAQRIYKAHFIDMTDGFCFRGRGHTSTQNTTVNGTGWEYCDNAKDKATK